LDGFTGIILKEGFFVPAFVLNGKLEGCYGNSEEFFPHVGKNLTDVKF